MVSRKRACLIAVHKLRRAKHLSNQPADGVLDHWSKDAPVGDITESDQIDWAHNGRRVSRIYSTPLSRWAWRQNFHLENASRGAAKGVACQCLGKRVGVASHAPLLQRTHGRHRLPASRGTRLRVRKRLGRLTDKPGGYRRTCPADNGDENLQTHRRS